MIEKTLLDYLSSQLTDVPVYMERPKEQPDMYIVLEKTGSSKTNHIKTATFAVQSYAPTMYEAAALNEIVKGVVESAIVLDDISKVTLNSDYNFTDTAEKRYRYQAVFDFVHF